jgi:hypothetical protein
MDLETPGTLTTPKRYLRALFDATSGYEGDPKLLTAFPAECHGGPDCNIFVLTFWSESGLLGLAAFVWIVVTGFTVGWRGSRSADLAWKPIYLGVFLALVA